jgi:peptidoglycan/xylan/chitin deacetylase (PgdA/CDA1 family)
MAKLKNVVVIALIAAISLQVASSNIAGATDTIPPDTTAATTTVVPTTTTVAPKNLTPRDIVKISKIQTKNPVVFITIDDGVTVSPQLAKVLDKSGVAITTFALPEMVWRARKWYRARENMTFENHTNSHVDMTSISPQKQKIELCHANKLIKEIVGERPTMYRPPRGSWSDENRTAMAKCGLKYAVLWNIVIDNTVPENLEFRKGDIILLHYVPSLPKVLPQILKMLKKQKLEPALLRDYLK